MRAIVFKMATTMNLVQEDYSTRLSVLGLGARHMLEAILLFHEPSEGYIGKMAGARIEELKKKDPDLIPILKTCTTINDMGNGAAHLTLQSVLPSEKGTLIDLSLTLAMSMHQSISNQFSKDFPNAQETMVRRKSSGARANTCWWSVDADETIYQYPTEVHIWLEA